MHNHQTILAAVDLTEEAPEVFEVAARVAREQDAELHLITVVKPITYPSPMPSRSRCMRR